MVCCLYWLFPHKSEEIHMHAVVLRVYLLLSHLSNWFRALVSGACHCIDARECASSHTESGLRGGNHLRKTLFATQKSVPGWCMGNLSLASFHMFVNVNVLCLFPIYHILLQGSFVILLCILYMPVRDQQLHRLPRVCRLSTERSCSCTRGMWRNIFLASVQQASVLGPVYQAKFQSLGLMRTDKGQPGE